MIKISKKATTIAIVNQKGGTGKTTTCENLGIGLAMEGKKVLLVDADPQGSLTISMGWQQPDELPTTLSTLMAKAMNDQSIPPGEGILHHAEGVDLIPANIELAGLEVALVNSMNREKMLKQVLEGAKHEYDFILLDCTPSLGMLTVNALAAADTTLIPVQAQYLSAKGLEQLLQTVQKVRRQINPKLKIEGILLTMTDSRTNYGQQIDNLIRGAYGSKIKVFDQTIPRSVRAAEISAVGKSIFQHDPKGKVAEAYRSLTKEVMANVERQLADILEATKEVIAENEAEKKNASPNLAVLLRDYLNLRKAERSEWSRYGQQKGTTDDLKTISQATVYLQRHELFTLEDLDIALQGVSEKATAIREDMQKAANRMKAITAIQTAVADCEKHKAVHDKYIKIGWKIRKEAYVESHKDELTAFNKAYRILKKHGADLNVDLKALQKEYDGLRTTHADLKEQLAAVNEELKPMKDIRYWVSKVLSPEQTGEKQPEPKHSLKERLQYEQEQKKQKQVQKAPKQKKQDMEL